MFFSFQFQFLVFNCIQMGPKLTLVNLELKFKFHSIKFIFSEFVDLCFGTHVDEPPISLNKYAKCETGYEDESDLIAQE